MNFRTLIAVLVLASALIAGVSPLRRRALADKPASAAAESERTRRAGVLASVGDRPITIGDLEDAIAGKDPSTRRKLADPEQRARLLADMIRYDVLIQEAERRGYADKDTVVRSGKYAAITAMQTRDLMVDPADVPAAEVTRYYTENARQYHRAELRRGSFIQLHTVAEARTLIAELRGKDRSAFAQAARERSTDARTKSQGGELGHFERHPDPKVRSQRPAQTLIDAVYALKKVGDISATPIAIDGQFGIVMFSAQLPELSIPEKQAEGDIRESLAKERSKQAVDVLAQQLRDAQKPETHPELLGAVAVDPPSPPLDIPSGFPPTHPTRVHRRS